MDIKFSISNLITKVSMVMAPGLQMFLAAFFVLSCPQDVDAQAKGYAVQIAALHSEQSAKELARGLTARGINAYWVKGNTVGMVAEQGQLYRVRIGKFPTIESAYNFAEALLDTGLLNAYAIAAYEPPPNAPDNPPAGSGNAGGGKSDKNSSPQVQSFATRKTKGNDTVDLIAAIGTRGWLLLSTADVLSAPPQNNSALSRQLASLAASVGARGWRLNNNLARIFGPPVRALPAGNSAAPVNLAIKDSSALNPAPSGNVNSVYAAEMPATPAPPVRRASAATNPEIGRGSVSPAITTAGGPGTKRDIYLMPPRLHGVIEMRDGRMWLKLRNQDSERSFTGLARVTLSDDRNQQDVAPMQFTLPPDMEESFPLDDAKVNNGSWILMVYDSSGAARLVRGASLAPNLPAQNAAAGPAPSDANQPALGPSYVTGYYDTTGWTVSQNAPSPSSPESRPQNNGLVPISDSPGSGASNPQSAVVGPSGEAQGGEVGPGQVTVVPKQIAVTSENVTLEFDIQASAPLNYISVTLRAGSFQDTRQALMSTPQGRVPFLVPMEHASAGFYYEVKDEAQRVLANGNGDFRRLAR